MKVNNIMTQITCNEDFLFALCADNSLWKMDIATGEWSTVDTMNANEANPKEDTATVTDDLDQHTPAAV